MGSDRTTINLSRGAADVIRHVAVDLGWTVGGVVEGLIEGDGAVARACHGRYVEEFEAGGARTTIAISRMHADVLRHVAVDLGAKQGLVIELLMQRDSEARKAMDFRYQEA